MIWRKDIKYDDGWWTEGDDNYKDTRKYKEKDNAKYEMTKMTNMCHIFENVWLKDINYDGGRWTEGDDNDKDTRKDKDKDAMTKRPNMCHIFENDTTQCIVFQYGQSCMVLLVFVTNVTTMGHH